MAHNAVLGTQDFTDKPVIDRTHPAIILGKKAKQASGTIERGTIVSTDASGLIVTFDAALGVAGVLTEAIDTTVEEVAPVLVHGTVVRANLSALDAAATDEQVALLAAKGIYAI